LLELAKENDALVGNASELAGLCANPEEQIDAPAISQTLRRYGCKTKSIRLLGGEPPLKRYSLSEANLQELVDRWVVEAQDDPEEDVPAGAAKV
jgi:hypothetical protein